MTSIDLLLILRYIGLFEGTKDNALFCGVSETVCNGVNEFISLTPCSINLICNGRLSSVYLSLGTILILRQRFFWTFSDPPKHPYTAGGRYLGWKPE